MLFKFKSRAASDLIMLEPDARALLQMMMGDDPVKGIVLAQDIPATIARLEAALANEATYKHMSKAANASLENDDVYEESADRVQLSQRATPMIQMLKKCLAEKSDLVWGV
jgi:cyclopropane-fatty-acyl-phospholipid synthase